MAEIAPIMRSQMSFVEAEETTQMAERILKVDTQRPLTDPFRLPLPLRQLVETRLVHYRAATQRQLAVAGLRSGSSPSTREAHQRLAERLRDGYRYVMGIPSFRLSETQRCAVLAAYGWCDGKQGNLRRKDRMHDLARQALAVTPYLQPELARYPDDLLQRIREELVLIEEAEALRNGGRQAAQRARHHALTDLRHAVSRVRGYYISASDELDKTLELVKLGFPTRKTPSSSAVMENWK